MTVKRAIQLVAVSKTQELVEVEFPIYREYPLDAYSLYMRQHADGSEVTVKIGGEETSIEVTGPEKLDGVEASDYFLGRGVYSCSEEEFDAALKAAQTEIAKVLSAS